MKISAYHKTQGDSVEWYEPLLSGEMDRVYMSKVFSFSPDYPYHIRANEIINSGTGYAIKIKDGMEYYNKEKDKSLPFEIEHIYPDYSFYSVRTGYGLKLKKQIAYGFTSRGCPRGCDFCHVTKKEGSVSHKVADISEFWRGQGNIELMDPNLLACVGGCNDILQQLADSKAKVNINQGLDARIITEKQTELIRKIDLTNIHFAWDIPKDEKHIISKLKMFKEITGIERRKLTVYVLTNKNTTIEEDLYRIYTLKEIGCNPYVMVYRKGEFVDRRGRLLPLDILIKKFTMEQIRHFEQVHQIERWVCNRYIWESTPTFREYLHDFDSKKKG